MSFILIILAALLLATPVLTPENITDLQSDLTVDFDALPEEIEIDSGWFTLSPDGNYTALVRRDGGLVIFDTVTGDLHDTFTFTGENDQPATVLDAMFGQEGQLAALHTDSAGYYASIYEVESGETQFFLLELDDPLDFPVRIWLDDAFIWLEVLAADGEHYVTRLPIPEGEDADHDEPLTLPSGPENDETAFVRIGRIVAPYAVTSSDEGLVKLWNLQTGEAIHTVELDAVPVFGRVDETTGTHLAWRDPDSQTLNLLDFEAGENEVITELDGEYVQAILLNPTSDVILLVAIGDDPVVVAVDAETGERYDLGEYRECGRVPDMIRLSADGTTLVIGCGVGLDIWRISEATEGD